jgi:hypothetical protein
MPAAERKARPSRPWPDRRLCVDEAKSRSASATHVHPLCRPRFGTYRGRGRHEVACGQCMAAEGAATGDLGAAGWIAAQARRCSVAAAAHPMVVR